MTAVVLSRWMHHDANLGERVASGLNRARTGDWETGTIEDRTADLRALVAETAYQMALLQGRVGEVALPGQGTELHIDPRATGADVPAPRRRAAALLYRTCALLAEGEQQAGSVETWTPAPPGEAAGLPAVAVVGIAVSVVVVGGAAFAYLGHEAAKVVDRELTRRAKARTLASAHATALEVIDRHTTREAAAGKQLPLDDASRAALDALQTEQNSIAGDVQPPFGGDLFPTGPGGTWTFSTGLLVGLAVTAGLWLARKQGMV